jgi:MoaA/NifB/PqqE/SkfB family radical SAM enzyme
MGCSRWHVSGGEAMLRLDFPEVLDYITRRSISYSLNTNGSLITPQIAGLMARRGTKMVALYGADAVIHDHITRTPGSFEAAMRGFSYLKEAGAGFTVQLMPMRDNWHQWQQMQTLARSLSPHWRVGGSWLYLSACGSSERNREIADQRLSPRDLIRLNVPVLSEDAAEEQETASSRDGGDVGDDRLFASCIAGLREFHVDPYGGMSWCPRVKDPALRYDLRRGTFRQAWEDFIPSCADQVRGGDEWRDHCGSCARRADCWWCAVYARLETGRYDAPIPYLCAAAEQARSFKTGWRKDHRRCFRVAGITVCVDSDLSFEETRFTPELEPFAVDGPGDDNVTLTHHFELPDLKGEDFGRELHREAPWAISRKNGTWFYRGISPDPEDPTLHRLAAFASDHSRGTIYSLPRDAERLRTQAWYSLSLFPTDQIWLAPLLADRQAVLLHSAAAVVNGQGLIFVGHSDAGKSTTVEMIKAASRRVGEVVRRDGPGLQVEILCDDRNIIREWTRSSGASEEGRPPSAGPGMASSNEPLLASQEGEWRVHGTWSHGDVADVSSTSAPLRALLFLQQDRRNEIELLSDRKEVWRRLLATLIRPMMTAQWWQKEMDVLEQIVSEVPCYIMRFDKSGAIVPELERLTR